MTRLLLGMGLREFSMHPAQLLSVKQEILNSDLTLIETMPMGEVDHDRTDHYLPLSLVRARLAEKWTLEDLDYNSGGPARYVRVKETGRKIGFITPLTHNFCESCNRVRLTCTGTLYMCLGQDDSADFRPLLRAGISDAGLDEAIQTVSCVRD